MARFETYSPCAALQPYIWQIAISEADGEAIYKVLPGTSLVAGFQYSGRLSYLQEHNEHVLETAGITGLHDRFRLFRNTSHTGSILVYFRPCGAAAFLPAVHELFAQSTSLDHFFHRSMTREIAERLNDAPTDAARVKMVEQFLLSQLRPSYQPDRLVAAAVQFIYQSAGTIRIKDLLPKLHISQSPLEKRFRSIVGTSPKKFASLVRLNTIISDPISRSMTDKGYEMGYYDQAHFIKDFSRFTGETPEKFFNK